MFFSIFLFNGEDIEVFTLYYTLPFFNIAPMIKLVKIMHILNTNVEQYAAEVADVTRSSLQQSAWSKIMRRN